MNILVVDDDVGTCDTLATGLRKLGGHEVVVAQTGATALAFARSQAFDVALIDQRLGEENGLDLLHELKQTRSGHAAAYIYTAWGTIADAVEAMRRGAADYLEKGEVDIMHLVTMLGSTPTPNTPADPRIRLVLTLVTANPTLDAKSLADAVDLSISRLRGLFREGTGVTLNRQQRAARLDRAAFLLRTSVRRISDIALSLGFQDLKWFERLFNKRFGCSPSVYRQSRRSA